MARTKAKPAQAWYAVMCTKPGVPRRSAIGGNWPDRVEFCNLGTRQDEVNMITTDKGWALDVRDTLAARNRGCLYELMVVGAATV